MISFISQKNNTFDLGPAGCRDCECNPLGSASLQCSSSGQCPCKANVTGFKCTQCSLGFYGLPIMSCRGRTTFLFHIYFMMYCTIPNKVKGLTSIFRPCRFMIDIKHLLLFIFASLLKIFTIFDIFQFSECNCSTVGSIPGTQCINDTAGQCQCKTGVTGRSCDQCKKYFTNFSDSGCSGNLELTIVGE